MKADVLDQPHASEAEPVHSLLVARAFLLSRGVPLVLLGALEDSATGAFSAEPS